MALRKHRFWKLLNKPAKEPADEDVDQRGYSSKDLTGSVSPHGIDVAQAIRGSDRPPAVMLHAVMPRSGSVYFGNLIKLHPEIYAYPNDIWEVPLLNSLGDLLDFQTTFFSSYSKNAGKIGENDLIAVIGAAVTNYLHAAVPPERRMLIKDPRARFLNYFYTLFPQECLVLLLRDGRDTVHSTLTSWPDISFEDACREWQRSADLAWSFAQANAQRNDQFLLVRYEELVSKPHEIMEQLCNSFGLPTDSYPFEETKSVPVQGSSSLRSSKSVDWDPIAKPESFQPVGRWKQWSHQEKTIFKEIAGDTLVSVGYEDSSDW